MAYVKDLWWKTIKGPDGNKERKKSARYNKGKRYLAVWTDQHGREKGQAFKSKAAAEKHANAMETDVERGEYIDRNAGKTPFKEFAQRWFRTVAVDPASRIHYESVYRLHVGPRIDKRQVKSIKPSDIQELVRQLEDSSSASLASTALLVVSGVLELAEADEAIKKNPAKSKIVRRPKPQGRGVKVWSDTQVTDVVDHHPEHLSPIPMIAAGCGMRQGEIFGLAFEDLDFDDAVIRVQRQIKKLGTHEVFALPKNDKTRTVPMATWVAEALRRHIEAFPPREYTLPWEKPDGEPYTVKLLFRWSDGRHLRSRLYSEQVWKPAIAAAGIIPPAVSDSRGRSRYQTSRKEGIHQLRHYYASVQLHEGVSLVALASYLGHDPKVTLSTYGHMLPNSDEQARRAIDRRLIPPAADSDGT